MPPVGACINGLGALPSPYGPTLRGAHNALRASKIKRLCHDFGVRAPNTNPSQDKITTKNIAKWN